MVDFSADISGRIDDMELPVCIGASRTAKKWRNRSVEWGWLVKQLFRPHVTDETILEYMQMPRDRQAEIKDVGGVVCGSLKQDCTSRLAMSGRKTKENILWRSVITLDADDCPEGYDPTDMIRECLPGVEAVAHTTHKHTTEHPRWRIFIPLVEWQSPFYYEAIARKVGEMIGMDVLDKSTFQPNRLMYWPSKSKDGEFLTRRVNGLPLSPRKFLEVFPQLRKESAWPRHPQEEPHAIRSAMTEREGEYNYDRKPLTTVEKGGIVGAFMQAYPIEEAIATFLSDVYAPAGNGRYTYVNGSSSGGLVIYDGMFAYSNHATDPANNGHDNNAFDLVRIHKFGYLDSKASKYTKPERMPSYSAMCDFAGKDGRVRSVLAKRTSASLMEDFGDMEVSEPDSDEWLESLDLTKHGDYKDTNRNQDIIMMNDRVLRNIRYDEFRRVNVIDDPTLLNCSSRFGSDEMLRNIATWYEEKYKIRMSLNRVSEVLSGTQTRRSFNPLHDFITGERWDGQERIDTLLIRCLGADDTKLNRAQTRTWMVGAVKRAFEPGCKFDYILVLAGPQGIGKSTFLWAIANSGEYLNESLQLDMRGRDLVEQLNNGWIFEIAELGGLKSVKEAEKVKAFISVKEDKMRKAYGHEVETTPRHCALAASTNETTFLSDSDSRKFWIISCKGIGNMDWVEWIQDNIHQIWAEAYTYYKDGSDVYLDAALESKAREKQKEYNTVMEDTVLGAVGAYLDYKIKSSWRSLNKNERRVEIEKYNMADEYMMFPRNKICAAEIRNELAECRDVSAQYLNKRVLPALGWELANEGKAVYVDKIYGMQRNVFYRPGTDGREFGSNLNDDEDDSEL